MTISRGQEMRLTHLTNLCIVCSQIRPTTIAVQSMES